MSSIGHEQGARGVNAESEFAGRIVLVTGAEGGIGSETARAFIAAGADVCVTGLGRETGAALAAALGARAQYETLDVTKPADWQRVVAQLVARHGKVDVLVNNAGYLKPGLTLETTSLDEWHRHFAVNTDSVLLGCQAVLPHLARDGAIVNVASAVGVRLHAEAPAYGVSKAATIALTRVAAQYCGRLGRGIRVNAVLPGPVDTAMMRSNVSSDEQFKALEAALVAKYPMERIGLPTDIARAVLFLASAQSSYINGAALTVDGGQTA